MTKVTKFIREVLDELRRATWPWDPRERGLKKYRELIDSTVVVFIATLLLAAWISLWDLILLSFMRALNWLLA
jgi:preprotein translocase subunit SecE